MSNSNGTTAQQPKAEAYHIDEQYLQQLLSELTVAKAKLVQNRERAAILFNSMGEGLVVTDEQGRITTVNSYALDCLGYEEDDLIGKWLPKTIVATDQSGIPLKYFDRPTVQALATGRVISHFTYYLARGGTTIPVRVTVSPIMSPSGPTGSVLVFQDLTSQMQLNVAKDEFVSLASHQLRTPATGMKSILSMLASGDFGPLTDLQQKYLEKAIHTNDRQLEIIEELLNVALVDAGKLDLDLDYLDLSKILQDCIDEHLPTMGDKGQVVVTDIDPGVTLPVDKHKVRMVIDNLISNASKYSPDQSEVRISLHTGDHFAELSVTDQGVGIDPEDMPRLFTKFTRIDNERSAEVGGTGLGLFLTKSLVELHGGSINVRSREHSGSTFVVHLPQKMSYRHD